MPPQNRAHLFFKHSLSGHYSFNAQKRNNERK